MKRFIFAILLLVLPIPALAGYESVTVSTAAIGLSSLAGAYGGEKSSCVCTLETAPIRFRMDGTAPTATEGHIMIPEGTLTISGSHIGKFKAIRKNGADGVLKCSCDDTATGTLQNIDTRKARTEVQYYAVAAASGSTTTETAITLTKSVSTGATATGNSFVVTSGKKFKITHISVASRGHVTPTLQTTTFNLRVNTAGAVTTSSTPIVFSARSATVAVASDWDRYIIPLQDGYEIPGDGTLQFGITAAATFATNAPTWDVNIIGYEY